jgi:ABC-type phosphate transport system permease subunit
MPAKQAKRPKGGRRGEGGTGTHTRNHTKCVYWKTNFVVGIGIGATIFILKYGYNKIITLGYMCKKRNVHPPW